MLRKIKDWIIQLICDEIVIGGHCGLCGKPISDELFPLRWAFGVCDECKSSATINNAVEEVCHD
jgi:hypothetical protein